jgi:hypothetical protein
MGCACNKALGGSEPNRYPEFPATAFDPMGAYEPPVRMMSASRTFYGYGEDGAPVYVSNSMGGSEPGRYPQFPATSKTFFGYGEDGAPVYVDLAAAATKFIGYEKDGSPIFVENMSSRAYLGNTKDGSPVFVNASTGEINYVNVAATAAIVGAGLAFGWLIANAARNIIK